MSLVLHSASVILLLNLTLPVGPKFTFYTIDPEGNWIFDKSVFSYDDGVVHRSGVLADYPSGKRAISLVGHDQECDCVAVVVDPSFSNLVLLQSDDRREEIIDEFKELAVRTVLSLSDVANAEDSRTSFEELVDLAIERSKSDPNYLSAQNEIKYFLSEHVGSKLGTEVSKILFKRTIEAFNLVATDMLENYGADAFSGDYDLSPIEEIIPLAFSDPQMVNLFRKIYLNFTRDPDVIQSVVDFIIIVASNMSTSDTPNGTIKRGELISVVEDLLTEFRDFVEEYFDDNEDVHPALLSLAYRFATHASNRQFDGVLLIADREVAEAWSSEIQYFELQKDGS